jgi:hypothetical protein
MYLPELPLSEEDIKDEVTDLGSITVEILIEVDEMVGVDLENFLDDLSSKITGNSTGLSDIDYRPAGFDSGAFVLEVTGKVEWDNLGFTDPADDAENLENAESAV